MKLESMTSDNHIRRLRVKRGGSHRLSPAADRNQNRWLDIFLSGNMLTEGFRIELFYHDEDSPFDVQTFNEISHTARDEYIFMIRKSFLRRVGFRGEFRIVAIVYDLDDSEFCRISIPVKGKTGRKLKYT